MRIACALWQAVRHSCSSGCTWCTKSRARRPSTCCASRACRRVSRAHGRDHRSHRADEFAEAPVSRRDGRGNDRRARTQLPRLRHPLYTPDTDEQGIVHVIGPQLGLTQPGLTIACGDSHTSTHGAFGAIAMGIGTSQVRDVLASQCLAVEPLKVRRIDVNGRLPARRVREGRDSHDHPPARRPGRRRLRLRVRRQRARSRCRWTSG